VHCAARGTSKGVGIEGNPVRVQDEPCVQRPKLIRDENGFIHGASLQGVLEWLQSTNPRFRCLDFYIVDKQMEIEKVWAQFRRALADEKWTGVGTVLSIGGVHWAAVYVSK
jgi:hypothetical protein